ncbi:helix-turn-helix domain-containing protein [Rhodohalobacter barkolensis]|uniref:AraC family transcriptional regulator n=1 Tax=Rhodohalobacter barkolensis TaxID=2053187 RepID=A0A2N0VIS7_9BACT|nr:AraC family transcriptional regulator [Rhodohalobacter barkolensis]PKD44074.1 AraC family transcriptional regulator [Rhodohalobacter barkolensis]
MKLSVKNMVCPRCVESVSDILSGMDIPEARVELGSVELEKKFSESELDQFSKRLQAKGFELIFDRETELVNDVKSALVKYIDHLENSQMPDKLSIFIAEQTNYNYSYLSKVYSDQTGYTIETHLIEMKIERVKELLGFRKWTLSEIAWKLKYSSVQYLSNQFKKVTGMTVTEYRKSGESARKTLDQI